MIEIFKLLHHDHITQKYKFGGRNRKKNLRKIYLKTKEMGHGKGTRGHGKWSQFQKYREEKQEGSSRIL